MANEYKADQGTITPTLFIGLGGVGSRMVDRIAKRAEALPNWESQLDVLTTFVSIDTNEGDQHLLKNIPQGNRINIAAFDKSQVIVNYRRSQEKQALQWIDAGYKPRAGIKPGAGQIRIESRLGFFHYSNAIKKRFRELVEATLRPGITWRQNTPPKYNVYLFNTMAGGTGSGSFLSTAYLITDVIEELGWQPRIISNLLMSTLITDKVGPELHGDIHANTYAALKELEHLTKLDYQKIKNMGREFEEFNYCRNEDRNKVSTVNHRPFFLSFIYDRPKHLSLPYAAEAIADTAFMQIFTPVAADMAGELDNYEKNLEELTHLPGKYRHVSLGYAKNYGACGAAAMVLPGKDLLEYSVLRFSAEAVRSQITFGLDKNEEGTDNDRIRALSKLAIDYSDPKFLRMSDDDRERKINMSFVDSVVEMARQDDKEEVVGGFWQQIVESTDEGKVTSKDEKGEDNKAETNIDKAIRSLKRSAEKAMNKVSIRDRNIKQIHPEGVSQYKDYVSKLKEDIRKAKTLIDEELTTLTMSASEGEPVSELKLNPIAERYLVIRLLSECEQELIPNAQKLLKESEQGDINNPSIRKRLEQENLENLSSAAEKKGIGPFKKVDTDKFYRVIDNVQSDFSQAVSASVSFLEAKVFLEQLRKLQEYLVNRSRQFLRVATKMDSLVNELERQAEDFRKGISSVEVLPTLRVEVFKTLEEPSERIWSKVYHSLFMEGGKYLNTFDRKALATTISSQFSAKVREDGRTVEKTPDEIVTDIRDALDKLGRKQMTTTIFGGKGTTGLNIINGLELEAKLMLTANNSDGYISDDEVEQYRKRKLRALSQLAGVIARVNAAESSSLDDGVIVNKTRLVVTGLKGGDTPASDKFMTQLKDVLSIGGVQVKEQTWHDPHLLITHDVITPIPLYYFDPIVDEVEIAYLKKSTDKNRSYSLHTDFNWEKSLPNLNPMQSEIAVDWSYRLFVKALLTGVIYFSNGNWSLELAGETQPMGDSLAAATYRLGELYQRESLRVLLDKAITQQHKEMDEKTYHTKLETMSKQFEVSISKFEMRDARGDASREELLDGPVWAALQIAVEEIKEQGQTGTSSSSAGSNSYSAFERKE